MVKIKKLIIEREMPRKKYRNIRNFDKYKEKIQEGIFRQLELVVKKLEDRNFIVKYFTDYKAKYYFAKYRTPKDIIIRFKKPFSEVFAEAIMESYK